MGMGTDGSGGYQIKSAIVQQSIPIAMNSILQKVFFFPEHHRAKNPIWPDFYLYGTTTTEDSQSDDTKRTLDGLLISEFFYRKVDSLQLYQS